MALCLDTSALLPFLLPEEPPTQSVREFWLDTLQRGEPLLAPPLLFAEITSVLRRYVSGGKILHQEASAAINVLFQLSIVAVHSPALYSRALDFAQELGRAKAYDAQYLAAAELSNCPIVTMDRGMYQSARTLGLEARLLP